MEEEKETSPETSSSLTYYILGAVVLALIAGGAYFLRPKSTSTPAPAETQVSVPVEASPTLGPITGLACERQWYNQVIGFPKYYIGVEGSDLMKTKNVLCNFTVSVGGKVVATASAQSNLTEDTGRGGGTFRCDTEPLELEPNVATVIDVLLKNDSNQTASCTETFVLPQ